MLLNFFLFLLGRSSFSFSNQAEIHYPKGAVLTVIDGFGESAWPEGNAIQNSTMPFLHYLKMNYPYQSLVAAQQPVGLVRGEPGSSAVGHQTLGLGRTTPSYYQILEKSLNRQSPESMINNKVLRNALRNQKRAHFVGLCTQEGIFSHTKFLPPMFEAAIIENVSEVYIHCILTTLVDKPSNYLKTVESLIQQSISNYQIYQDKQTQHPITTKFKIAAVYSGETAMNKMLNWTATQVAYEGMVDSNKLRKMSFTDASDYLDSIQQIVPIFDPICLYQTSESECESSVMKDNDVVIFFHFREDKSYQLAKALIDGLPQASKNPKLHIVPLIVYHHSLLDKAEPIIPAIRYNNSIGEWLSKKGYKQLRVAEKYKKGHATVFFSGGIMQELYEGEDRHVDFSSLSEDIVDLFPEMNITLVTSTAVEGINRKNDKGENYYKFIFVNFANVDATGHAGNFTAVTLACRIIDEKLKELYQACKENDFAWFITADHGNGEEMTEMDGRKQVFHTLNNVPFIAVYNPSWNKDKSRNWTDYKLVNVGHKEKFNVGKVPFIGNVAPSILYTMGIDIPPEMEEPIISRQFLDDESKNTNHLYPFQSVLPFSGATIDQQQAMIFIGFTLGVMASILTALILRILHVNICCFNDRRDPWPKTLASL